MPISEMPLSCARGKVGLLASRRKVLSALLYTEAETLAYCLTQGLVWGMCWAAKIAP